MDFVEPDLNREVGTSPCAEIQLLACYSRNEVLDGQDKDGGTEDADVNSVDEIQLWDISHGRTELSTGFLGLECFGDGKKTIRENSESLRGPEEWVR